MHQKLFCNVSQTKVCICSGISRWVQKCSGATITILSPDACLLGQQMTLLNHHICFFSVLIGWCLSLGSCHVKRQERGINQSALSRKHGPSMVLENILSRWSLDWFSKAIWQQNFPTCGGAWSRVSAARIPVWKASRILTIFPSDCFQELGACLNPQQNKPQME